MDLGRSIKKAYKTAQKRGWSKIYVMIDVHDTITSSNYREDETIFYPEAVEALRILSTFKEIELVLWTCCYPEKYDYFRLRLDSLGINVKYINETPIQNTAYGDFRKKPYFSVLIDDKAGFDPKEWGDVVDAFIESREMLPLKSEPPLGNIELFKKYDRERRKAASKLEFDRLANECVGIYERLNDDERKILVTWLMEQADGT